MGIVNKLISTFLAKNKKFDKVELMSDSKLDLNFYLIGNSDPHKYWELKRQNYTAAIELFNKIEEELDKALYIKLAVNSKPPKWALEGEEEYPF